MLAKTRIYMEHFFPGPFSSFKRFSLLLLITCLFSSIRAQITTNISDTINKDATAVLAINLQTNSIVVEDPSKFQVNDTVLLMKMQGSSIEETNDVGFGTIGNTNGVGLYEIATVCSVLGNSVSFQNQLVNNYAPTGTLTGKMQMIKVPHYAGDVNVNGALTAPAWNGTTGGVLAFIAEGTVTLNANISMDGKGFRGGHSLNSSYVCIPSSDGMNPAENSTDYFYDLVSGEGACKGEGIAEYIVGKEGGRGNQANGGGGGNNNNSGGGGGGNYGIGGNGGTKQATAGDPLDICRGSFVGEPGSPLDNMGYTLENNCIFMGGGGGSGHADSDEGQAGGNGGGIIIIIANRLRNGHPTVARTISANGDDAQDAGDDGGAGAGAGGAILLQYQVADSRAFNVEAKGGIGGGASYSGSNCNGPGGGGGGGVIWTLNPLGTRVTTDVSGGRHGITAATSGCGGQFTNGATTGHNGIVMTGLNVPQESVAFVSCVLATDMTDFQATTQNQRVYLEWATSLEINHKSFVIERSKDGTIFENIGEVSGRGNADKGTTYEWEDKFPYIGKSYYRLKEVDQFGNYVYSSQVEVNVAPTQVLTLETFPNPVQRNESLNVKLNVPTSGRLILKIRNMVGTELFHYITEVNSGINEIDLLLPKLSAGTYILSSQMKDQFTQHKMVVW